MAERIGATDAPPPPPPPLPSGDGPGDRAPEATPELANAMAQAGKLESHRGSDTPSPPQEAGRRAPDVSTELASALPGQSRGSSAAEPGPEATGTESADQRQQAGTPGGGTRAGIDNPVTGRPDMAERYPADYVKTPGPLPRVEQPHENPENWVADINPDRDAPWRENNCGECARASDSTWHGRPAVAGALARPEQAEVVSRMTEWAGEEPVVASMSEVGQVKN
jgi:hypothetical protein